MDTQAVLTLMQEVAAEVITPRFRHLGDAEIMEKNPGDLVTVADREAEVLITRALLEADPGVLVVGEEATAADPGLPDLLATAEHAWTVDPVDGTKNFVHGSPDHAVMVAELHGGRTSRAWIWQPEHGLAFVAERGAGLFRNGERVTRPAPPADLADLAVLTSHPSEEGSRHGLVLRPTAWCCGVDYPWLVTGRADALVYGSAKPWDHAPGSLLLEEVGGVVRHLDGTPYLPGRRDSGRLIAAADAPTWDAVAGALAGRTP